MSQIYTHGSGGSYWQKEKLVQTDNSSKKIRRRNPAPALAIFLPPTEDSQTSGRSNPPKPSDADN
jgi:hypothetical protein